MQKKSINIVFFTKESLVTKNIPFYYLVGFSSDTTNVMAGGHKSKIALFKKDNDDLAFIKCSCHGIHIVNSHECSKLSNSAEELLRNLASYFHQLVED